MGEPLPEDVYVLVLKDEVTVEEGPRGPYWKWTFTVDSNAGGDKTHAGRKLFHRTSLAENAAWKMKETFLGFGAPADTDTDDLIGSRVKAMVVQSMIESGTRKGEMSNDIKQILPAADAETGPSKPGTKKNSKAKDTPDLF